MVRSHSMRADLYPQLIAVEDCSERHSTPNALTTTDVSPCNILAGEDMFTWEVRVHTPVNVFSYHSNPSINKKQDFATSVNCKHIHEILHRPH